MAVLYPLAKILLQIKNIQNLYLSFGVIFYLLIMIIIAITDVVLVIYFIRYIIKNNINKKVLWIILILLFNVFIIPYFYMKYVEKEESILFNTMLYIIPMLLYLVVFGYGTYVYTDLYNQKKEEEKIIEATKNYYSTKDTKTTFTFGYGYKQKDVGEYDLYVINTDKSIVFSAFTYNTIDYEQKTVDEFLNKGIEDLKVGKKNFIEFSKKKEIKGDNYLITTVSYEGEAEVKTKNKVSTSDCIYKLSVISFDSDPGYLVYVIEVVTKANYNDYKTELLDILKSVSVNFN
jgi:energy-coupling factor transporter transmembrane protein EcfT